MRVVVTGATSMIGVALIKECIKNECEVLGIVRKGSRRLDRLPQSKFLKLKCAELCELPSVQGDGGKYDVFFHFAWDHTIKTERDSPVAQEENIRTTLYAVELAHKLSCAKFVGAGSQAEYGSVDGTISEDTRPEPIISYGMAKLSANMLSRRMCELLGMTHIWARVFSVYGCNDNEGTMINYAIDKFSKGETAKFSAATQLWNYLHEDDAGKIFYLFAEKKLVSGIYCVASHQSRILKEYITELGSLFGKDVKYEFESNDSLAQTYGLDVDMKKTIAAIDFIPQISFKDGIKKIILNSSQKLH